MYPLRMYKMGFMKLDERIRTVIETGITNHHRSLFFIVGANAQNQVAVLYNILSKAQIKCNPTVLWCYKTALNFKTNRKTKIEKIMRRTQSGQSNENPENIFENFISGSKIKFSYYKDSKKLLGNTFQMLILQDFEALSPNVLARTIETVEGGGLITILLPKLENLRQLHTLAMDAHARFRTPASKKVSFNFNNRFLLSLNDCNSCLILDDNFLVLPLFSNSLNIKNTVNNNICDKNHQFINKNHNNVNIHKNNLNNINDKSNNSDFNNNKILNNDSNNNINKNSSNMNLLNKFDDNINDYNNDKNCRNNALNNLKESFSDIPPLGLLLPLCKTLCQAKVLIKSFEQVSRFTTNSVVSLTSARGRGKSALLGLIVSAAISISMSNIYVVAPSPENLVTFFDFVLKGLKTLGYDDKNDLNIGYENFEGVKLVTSIRIKKTHRQNVQYLAVGKFESAHNAELIICDEAAAIPLPFVRKLIGPHLLFISSTVNGYEGTGRSLSLKLFNELRQDCLSVKKEGSKSFSEFTLQESIRYADKDPVESWLNKLLCLDDLNIQKVGKTPLVSTQDCSLFYVDKDALFSYHPVAETFLQKLVNIFVSSHYKNSPNDLQMLADAPAHHVFVLLPSKVSGTIPEIYCAIQICFEGGISSKTVIETLDKGKRGSGDLIPWLVSQQFCESNFANLKGARIVRIATNPSYTSMGYGSCAMDLLVKYFKFPPSIKEEMDSSPQNELEDTEILEECIQPKSKIPPLLVNVNERPCEKVEYLGVSYGLTAPLLKFWKRNKFIPVYLRQSANSLTGEYTNVMIRSLDDSEENKHPEWLINYYKDFRSRFLSLLGYSFQNLTSAISLSLVNINSIKIPHKELTADELYYLLSPHDIKRLEAYSHNMFDLAYVMDLVPIIAKLCLDGRVPDIKKHWIQLAVILSLGLQHRSLNSISGDLNIPQNQVVTMFNKVIKKTVNHFNFILEKNIEENKEPSKTGDENWKEELAKNPNAKSISIAKYLFFLYRSQKRKKVHAM